MCKVTNSTEFDENQVKTPNQVADGQGFYVPTEVKKSRIPNAGNARFFMQAGKKGSIIRRQKIDKNIYFRNVEEILAHGIDLEHLGHMGCSPPDDCEYHKGVVFVNSPPMYSQHSHSDDANIYCVYTETEKITILKKDVVADEEFMQDYAVYKQVDWYEEFLNSHHLVSLRQFGAMLNGQRTTSQ